jgi:hypothetical protein
MFSEGFMRDFFGMRNNKALTEDDVRRIIREELKRAVKSGCKNFQMRGGMFCGNCGFHYDEH